MATTTEIATQMEMAMPMEIKTAIITLSVVVMDKQDSVVVVQIPLGLHTDGHMEIQEMTYTPVVYEPTLPLVKKGLPR